MSRRSRDLFDTIRTEGGLLPPDLLKRIVDGDRGLKGLGPADYHLVPGERINEVTSRSWNRLLGAWTSFRDAAAALAPGAPDAGLTRDRWLLVLFHELGYGRLEPARSQEIDGRAYPVSHRWGPCPIHLVGFRTDLDTRTKGVVGAARQSPHSMVQEFLTRSPEALWGCVSNGLRLRLLRDNASLTRQAYVEFDLEAMMLGQVYADFVLLWLLCHQSRVETRGDGDAPEGCWLEVWSKSADEQGTRALEQLRTGVEAAIVALGRGYLSHPANGTLREALKKGTLTKQDYYRQLLRLVYRLLFLFVAEDRDLLLIPDDRAQPGARRRYLDYYSTRRIRRLAEKRRGGAHPDLYRGLRLVMEKLGDDAGCPDLALPALGSLLWSRDAVPAVTDADIANRDFLGAIRALAFADDQRRLRAVDYRNLGSEELGSVYESLLELHPEINADAGAFDLTTAGGHERKTTGSYYTPSSLIQCLLDSALNPVLEEATRQPEPEAAILRLKICDPACGSGHFLVAAAHRVAKRLATVRSGDEEPAPEATRTALRDVIGHCIYGVDLNEMAVELCKVSLWMEALEPGKPLSFLDHRIVCGNSLLGTTPALIATGIPDDAFSPIEGDDKKVVSALKKQNKQERHGQTALFTQFAAEAAATYGSLVQTVATLDAIADDAIAGVRQKESAYRTLAASERYRRAKLTADAWCAAFVWKRTPGAVENITHDVFLRLQSNPDAVPAAVRAEVARLAHQYQFLHWHIVFPDIFRVPVAGETPDNEQAGWSGGFDAVLGNPPWERIKLQEKEWFAVVRPDIAGAANAAARRKLIASLERTDPDLFRAWLEASRVAEGESHLVRSSKRYPLCGRGDVNSYAIFAETNRLIVAPTGRVGCIVPSGIATDDTTKFFFGDLMQTHTLSSLLSFREIRGLFLDTDSRNPFCLLTITGGAGSNGRATEFVFFAEDVTELSNPERRFTLTADDIALLNPNTRTCPVFRTRRDAEITKSIYRRVPVLIREGQPEGNPWAVWFMAMFHMANDSGLFRTRAQLEADGWRLAGNVFRRDADEYLPLYEAKMIHHFDHRFGDYADKPADSESTALPDVPVARLRDASYQPLPRYWVPATEVRARLAERGARPWLMGWRDICRSTDERTVIAGVLPTLGVGDKFLLMFPSADSPLVACLLACLNSLALDYVARQKTGGTSLKYYVMKQIALLPPLALAGSTSWSQPETVVGLLTPRVLELTYTAWDLEPFARDCGYDGPPFRWDEERRFLLRCELDAAFFHLYGVVRDDVDYIMDTFPIVKRKDEARFDGDYRTKRVILDIYDRMQRAIDTEEPYQTLLDPPPADPRVAHPPRA